MINTDDILRILIFKKIILRLFCCCFLLLNNACAQENLNPLTELPLQIKLGKTTYSEIKDKGDCFRKKMINHNDYICKTMSVDMDNERYTLSLDDDQRVNTLYFSDENNMTKASILPKNWKNLGLFLRKGDSGRGTSKKDFITIIKSLGIKDFIEKCEKEDCKFIYVRFKLDNVYYSAIFRQYSTWGFEPGLKSFYISTVSY